MPDLHDTGQVLAGLLDRYLDTPDVIVLGLPRGGVAVAYEVATALGAPLHVFVVRKLAFPAARKWQWAPLPAAACWFSAMTWCAV
jgi:predicted phosphoribosyltransferase